MWRSIHFLRAIAAILVVVHHVPHFLNGRVPFSITDFAHGASGVDIFFIISGFVMYQATQKKSLSGRQFLLARILRIVPMYWLATIALATAALLLPTLFTAFKTTPAATLQSLFFLPVYDYRGFFHPVLQQGWTLQYEMLFYLTTAAFVGRFKGWSSLFSAAVIAAGALTVYMLGEPLEFRAIQILAPISVEFLAGVLIGMGATSFFNASQRVPAPLGALIGSMLLTGGALLILSHIPGGKPDMGRPLFWGGGAILVVLGALMLERQAQWLKAHASPLYVLGDVSYVLYLTHGFSFSIATKIYPASNYENQTVATLLLTSAALALALGIHYTVEKPLSKWLHQKTAPLKGTP